MNIGIFSPYLDTMTGGEKYILTAASCLSKNHKVSIFWDEPSIIKQAENRFDVDLSRVNIVNNIFSSEYGFFRRFFATRKYDRIIYLSDGSIPFVGSKKLLVHFQFPVEWINTNSFPFLFKKLRISKIICNSYFTKSFIDKKLNSKSFVLYPPALTNRTVEKTKSNVILTVGRFSLLPNGQDFKKLKVLVDAFLEFQKKRLKGWKLVIITSVSKDLEAQFESFEKSIKSSNIKIYKNCNFNEILKHYSSAKIYWHAAGYGENLNKHPERAEHFGMSTVEAMSCGAVPIVINAGGQPEIVKNGENGFLWNDIKTLVARTHKVATDKELFEKISKNAVISSRSFSEERFCEELNHLIL